MTPRAAHVQVSTDKLSQPLSKRMQAAAHALHMGYLDRAGLVWYPFTAEKTCFG